MPQTYDLIALGTGTVGSTVATAACEAGWRVAIADPQPFGGTCALRGCDPKKVLVHAAHVLDQARRLDGQGLTGDLRIDWPVLMEFKRRFTEPVPEKTREKYADLGIDTFHGAARFTGARTLEVEGETLEAEHIVIATGSRPVPLDIPGKEHLTHSDDFLELDDLPKRIAFIGGGYISCEFAHLAARAGAEEVHIVEGEDRLLGPFEEDIVGVVQDATRALGIHVHLNREAQAVEAHDDGSLRLTAESNGQKMEIEADAVVHGAGRVPWTDGLDAEAAGLDLDDDGSVAVDEHLRSTSNPAVWAGGDVARAGKPLTPTATIDARVIRKNVIEDEPATPNYTAMPSVVFTTPRLASVGMTEAEARDAGHELSIGQNLAVDWPGVQRRGLEHAAYKILVDADTDAILGAHLCYPHAEEIINLFSLALRHGLTATDLKATPFAYPCSASEAKHMLP